MIQALLAVAPHLGRSPKWIVDVVVAVVTSVIEIAVLTNSQGGGGCPISLNSEGQEGQSSEQPDLVTYVPPNCRAGSREESSSSPNHFLTVW